MSVQEVYEKLSKAFVEKDEAGLREVCAPDVEFRMPGMAMTGTDAYIEVSRVWWTAFPDVAIEVKKTHVAGDTVIEEGVFSGTNTGPLPGPTGMIPATGKRAELPYVDIFTFRGDKLVSDRLSMDRLSMLEQLGLVPSPAPAG